MTRRSLPPADLSNSFDKSPRAAGLRLPENRKTGPEPTGAPQRPVDPVREPSATKPVPPSVPETAAEAADGTHRAPTAAKAAKKSTAAPSRPVAGQGRLVLWTPVSIRARMQAVRAARGTLYLDQVLDAIEATVDELPHLITTATRTRRILGPLFERTTHNDPETTEQRVQLTIRGALDSQLQVIDHLVHTTGAPSRSALINAALDATLPPA